MNIQEKEVKSVITKTDIPVCDYAVNPYVGCTHGCKYCYASFMKRFTGHQEPWGDFLDVKYWTEIQNAERYRGKEFFFGTVTDPYNPQEEQYRRTRSLLEQLRGSGAKITLQTKSDLVLRDIDLIRSYSDIRVGFSINTLDETFRAAMDNAVSIERRLKAMKILHDEGVRTTCFVSPIFPGITDVEAIIDRVKEQCNLIWLENLSLRGSFKPVIMDYIRSKHTDLLNLYEEIYYHRKRDYWQEMDKDIHAYADAIGLEYVRDDDTMTRPFHAKPIIVNFFHHEEVRKSAKK